MILRPFFKHFGSKWTLSAKALPPEHDRIVEPFAGGAGYSLRYGAGKRVDLYDLDPDVVHIWGYLLGASQADVLALPVEPLHAGADVFSLGLPRGAAVLIQRCLSMVGKDSVRRMPPSLQRIVAEDPGYGGCWSVAFRRRIAEQIPAISRWRIHHASYLDAPDVEATWSIDPPYQGNRHADGVYRVDEAIDFDELALWCVDRRGLVMVHEQVGADWLPFTPLAKGRSGRSLADGKKTKHQEVWFVHRGGEVVYASED